MRLYSGNEMKRAFVVQIGNEAEPERGRLTGSVEEVDSGRLLKFRTAEQLLGFLLTRTIEVKRRDHPMTATLEKTDARVEVDAVLSALERTWNNHDTAANSEFFTENADFVNVLGTRFQGRKAIEAQHLKIHQGFMRNSVLTILDRSVRMLSPEIALAHIGWQMSGADKVPGWNVPEIRHGVITYVLVLENGRWLVTGAHNTDTVNIPNN
jgi:uncharacterized protein (TIGR02246 family)